MTVDPATASTVRDANADELPMVEALCVSALDFETRRDAESFVNVLIRRDATFLVAVDDSNTVLGAVIGSRNERDAQRAHLELLVVSPDMRRQGIGRALVNELTDRFRNAGCTELVVQGNPPWYCWPAVDVRYTAAVCLFENEGFERVDQMMTMTAPLRGNGEMLDTTEDEERLAESGIEVRRLEEPDRESIEPWLASWSEGWKNEALGGLRYDPVRCHVAVRDGQWLGFAAWGVNAPGLFGPMGTAEQARGSGIGSVLLRRCLADQYVMQLDRSEISWVGPYRFYSRTVGAYLDRIFWSFRRSLTGDS